MSCTLVCTRDEPESGGVPELGRGPGGLSSPVGVSHLAPAAPCSPQAPRAQTSSRLRKHSSSTLVLRRAAFRSAVTGERKEPLRMSWGGCQVF